MMFKALLLETSMAVLGTMSFSVLFGVSRRHYLACGICGGVGWMTYFLLQWMGCTSTVATFAATFALSSYARAVAARRQAPTILFLLCGIFALVPGAGIYYTAYAFFLNDGVGALEWGARTLQSAIAITIGICAAYSIPARVFHWKTANFASEVQK